MKKIALAFIISIFCAALCACGAVSRIDLGAVPTEEATPSPVPMSSVSVLEDEIEVKNSSALRVGFSAGFDEPMQRADAVAGFSGYCESAGVAYEVREPEDAQQQAEDIAAFVAQGFDAIAISPIDASAEAVTAAVAQAVAAGIPVVSIAELAGADVVIVPEDYDFSVSTAEKLLRLSGAQIAILDSTEQSPNLQARRDAYKFVTDAAGAVVLANEAVGSVDQAREVAERLMREYPQLGGILAVDTDGLVGAAQALPEGSRIAVGGAEIGSEELALMEAGLVKVAAAQLYIKKGSLAAEAALGLALGEYYPPEIKVATSKVYTEFTWPDAVYELQGLEPPLE